MLAAGSSVEQVGRALQTGDQVAEELGEEFLGREGALNTALSLLCL